MRKLVVTFIRHIIFLWCGFITDRRRLMSEKKKFRDEIFAGLWLESD
jgi:hypothetical protein